MIYPNLSICGFPYAISGVVTDAKQLSHRGIDDLRQQGISFALNTTVTRIEADAHRVVATTDDQAVSYPYTKLIVATGATPKLPAIPGLEAVRDHVFVLHAMADFDQLEFALSRPHVNKVAVIGAGYIGIEMTEALRERHFDTTLFQRGPEILSTVAPSLGHALAQVLQEHGTLIQTDVTAFSLSSTATGAQLTTTSATGHTTTSTFDLVVIATGVTPNATLLAQAGAQLGIHGSVKVDAHMHTSLPDIWAAGDVVETHHRLLDATYLPLGTTAHKQGRIAGANVAGQQRAFSGVVGTQVLKAFDWVIGRTGLSFDEAAGAGFQPFVHTSDVFDRNPYYPMAQKLTIMIIGDQHSGQLLGAQLLGHLHSDVAKRTDIFATAIYHHMTVEALNDLDLTYSPPLASPWDSVQQAAQDWEAARL